MKPALVIAVLVLGALLALQWLGWPPDREATPSGDLGTSAAPVPVPAAESPLDLLSPPEDIEDYAVVVERPLFLPDRRPPSEDEADQEEAPIVDDAALKGLDLNAVIMTPGRVVAWVRNPAEKELQDLELGDEINGWNVKEIQSDRLVLERQGQTDTLTLRDYQNMPPPRPAVRIPPRPADRRKPQPPAAQGSRNPPAPGARNPGNRENGQQSDQP
jgi:hypothetical protein